MKEFWNTIQGIFTALGGWLGYYLGGCDGLLIALVVFVVTDYITGVMCAVIDKKLSSEIGFKGIFKKVLIFILVGIQIFLMYRLSVRETFSALPLFSFICQMRVFQFLKTRRIWDFPYRKS